MQKLTEKQQKVLGFIEQRLFENAPPSQKEIADHFGLVQNSIFQTVSALRKKGYLEQRSVHRGVRLSNEYLAARRQAEGLPVVGRVAAGEPILAEQNITDYIDIGGILKKPHKGAFLLKVSGDSMIDDGILDGDFVIVRPQNTVENGQIGVVMVDDEATVKHVLIKENQIILKPANVRYKPKTFKKGDKSVHIIGKVVGCFRTI